MSIIDSTCEQAHQAAQRGDASERSAEVLLECFRRGRLPIRGLVNLALSDRTAVAELGAWIASELPASATTVFAELLPCVEHPSHRVRHSMLDVVASQAAAVGGGDLDALILDGAFDEHVAVRCKAIELMARWTDERIDLLISSPPTGSTDPFASEASFRRRGAVVTTDGERNELRLLVSAVKARNAFEDGVIRVGRSRSRRMAETAKAFLRDVGPSQS